MSQTNKRGTLSSEAATVLSTLSSRGLASFTLDDFVAAANWSRVRASKLLHQLKRSGWVERIARGRYLIVPLEAGPESAWTEDALVSVCRMATPSAIAYWTACHYWNWTEQVPRTVFAQTLQRVWRSEGRLLGVAYRLIRVRPGRFFGTVERRSGQSRFSITDPEKTLVDAFDRPDLCGGIRQVAAMLPQAASVSWDKVDEYLERLDSGAVYKRIGFLVEAAGRKLRLPKLERRVEGWRAKLTGGYAPLEPGGPSAGALDTRWRLRLNARGFRPEMTAR
jgi:predicted transcriptional regulator of viral defense system